MGMRLFIVFILVGLLVFLFGQMWYFYEHGTEAARNLEKVRVELEKAKHEQAALMADRDYYRIPANLEKELRARFNYRAEGETMIVIVENNSSTPTSTKP